MAVSSIIGSPPSAGHFNMAGDSPFEVYPGAHFNAQVASHIRKFLYISGNRDTYIFDDNKG